MALGIGCSPQPILTILNIFLRSERDAVAAYGRVIDTRGHDAIPELPRCLRSHRKRAELLRLWIIARDGTPTAESEIWESCRCTDGVSDSMLGNHAVLTALERGETYITRLYLTGRTLLDAPSQHLVAGAIIPEHLRIMAIIAIMKYSIG